MADDEIDFNEEYKKDQNQSGVEDLDLDDMGTNYLKNPAVGESIILDIEKVQKNKNISAKDKDGQAFKTNLSSVDYKIDIVCKDSKVFSPRSWEVWGKIKSLMKEQKKIQIKIKVEHVVDGSIAKDKPEKVAKLNDITLEEAKEWITKSANAKKDGTLYKVTLVE